MRTIVRKRWFLFAPPLVLLAIAGFGFLTMTLWNALLPTILHLPLITFWQALGLLILARLLFGGHCWSRGGHHSHWKNHMKEKWEKMTPEEREQFRHKWPHAHSWNNCCSDKTTQEKNDDQRV